MRKSTESANDTATLRIAILVADEFLKIMIYCSFVIHQKIMSRKGMQISL